LGISALLEVVPKLLAGISLAQPQSQSGVSLAPKPTREDAFVDFHSSAVDTENQINGMNFEPGAWTSLNGEPFKLLEVTVNHSASNLSEGEVGVIDNSVVVGCRASSLRLLDVQPSGKSRMSALDWFRGLKSDTVRLGRDD
jgi:methionyl-tRNA formyltransferase